ncbi:hypothetical protein CEXT_410911 [Caerostris extrusa]|uniref:Uncharacterized protein n=1 Tax=Caerostris extrusa TaxID=172846 RepID=A0AAV4MD15_CAEEX|nr:hypothetical protein CEXT_410911 [Caerostris extrusa]
MRNQCPQLSIGSFNKARSSLLTVLTPLNTLIINTYTNNYLVQIIRVLNIFNNLYSPVQFLRGDKNPNPHNLVDIFDGIASNE